MKTLKSVVNALSSKKKMGKKKKHKGTQSLKRGVRRSTTRNPRIFLLHKTIQKKKKKKKIPKPAPQKRRGGGGCFFVISFLHISNISFIQLFFVVFCCGPDLSYDAVVYSV